MTLDEISKDWSGISVLWKSSNEPVFARKIVRLFGPVSEADVENEANAVSALCTGAQCKYVVEVLKHGWLTPDHSYYFIDMEYCIVTLEDLIRGMANESQGLQHSEDLPVL